MTRRNDKTPERDTNPVFPSGLGKGGPKGKDTPFDLWLNRGLHQLYDGVAKEPIPDELLKLIEDDRKK